jgi:1-acyl-sn-glycerol-3-phosphate acyltransferase
MRWLSYRVFKGLGWRIEGVIPDLPKMVIIGAPHTSNWDFFLFLAVIHHFHLKVRFLGKHTLFRWPFGFMFRAVGGIPVDRNRSGGIIGQVKREFDSEVRMTLVIAPEGTRSAAPQWKSGFVKIAEELHVPVVPAGVDSASKTVTIGPPLTVDGDRKGFMDRLRAFYADKNGVDPSGKGPVRLAREESS